MGKIVIKMIVMLAVVAGISNYAMYIMTGKSPFSGFSPNLSMESLEMPDIVPEGNDKAFKWTDENGVVHYSSEAPAHIQAEEMNVNPNTNLIQGTKPKPISSPPLPGQTSTNSVLPQGNIYNPETIRTLIDDAKNVQTTLDERNKALEQY